MKDYEEKTIEVLSDIIRHGYGEIRIIVSEVKGKVRTKVVICCGKSFVYFEEKVIPGLDKPDIL